jgi:hypothetical protein
MAVAFIALVAVLTVQQGRSDRLGQFWNFGFLHTGAQCLVDRCDPYIASQLDREADARGEWDMDDITSDTPLYPPSSLMVVLPLESVGWPVAGVIFNYISGVAMAAACFLLVWRLKLETDAAAAMVLLATLLGIPFRDTLMTGNPALLCVALSTIAVLVLMDSTSRASGTFAWIALGIALALKPQLAIGAWIFLAWRPQTRTAALKAMAVFAGLLGAGLIAYRIRLGSFHFVAQYAAVVKLALTAGQSSDASLSNGVSFTFLNLQATFLRIPGIGRHGADALSWAITACLAGTAWRLGGPRRQLSTMPWTMLALIVTISLLPLYHQGYDRVIVLLMAPAVVEMAQYAKRIAWGFAAVLAFWMLRDTVVSHVLRRWYMVSMNPKVELVMCAVLIWALARGQVRRTEAW